MAKDKIATAVDDFTVLPLRMSGSPAYPHETTHYLYLRPNAPRAPTDDTPREVFLVNIPIDSSPSHFRALFAKHVGHVRMEDVEFESSRRLGKGSKVAPEREKGKKRKRGADEDVGDDNRGTLPDVWDREVHRSGATAVVRFVDRASAELALKEARKIAKGGKEIPWDALSSTEIPPLGPARYLAHHRLRYPRSSLLQTSVDAFMAAFSAQEAERDRQRSRQRAMPDEDGFITVTRGGRTGPAREEEARAKEEELKKREKKRVGGDFYRFQVREKRKEQAKDLVRSFEDDQRKVEAMRRRKGKIRPE